MTTALQEVQAVLNLGMENGHEKIKVSKVYDFIWFHFNVVSHLS